MRFRTIAVCALMCLAATAYADFAEPGDLTVGGTITATGLVTASAGLSVSGTMSASDYSCPAIAQRYVFTWTEGETQAQAWPDTIVRAGDDGPPMYVFMEDGEISDVVAYAYTSGTGHDSLIVDVKVGAVSIFDSPEDRPRILATAANEGNTRTGGSGLRDAVIDPAKRDVNEGDVLYIEARVYGTASPNPTGLVVWVEFEPDYH